MNLDISRAFKSPFCADNSDDLVSIYLIALGISVLSFIVQFAFNMFSQFMMPFMGYFMEDVAGGLFAVSAFGVFYILMLLINTVITSFLTGYVLESSRLEVLGEQYVMPRWEGNFKKMFLKGLVIFVVSFIFMILVVLISAIPVIIGGVYYFLVYGDAVPFSESQNVLMIGVLGVTFILFFMSVLVFMFIFPVLAVNFAYKESFGSAFDIFTAIRVIYENFLDFLVIVLLGMLMFVVSIVISIILCCTCIGSLLMPIIYSFIFPIIVLNMVAQLYRNSLQLRY